MTTKTRTAAKTPVTKAAAAPARGRTKVADAVEQAVSTQSKETVMTVTVCRHGEEGETRQETLDVHVFQTAPAYVKVKHGTTRQPVQYEGLRVDVEISRPCYVEEIDEVLAEISAQAYNKVCDEIELLLGAAPEGELPAEQEEEEEEEGKYSAEDLAEMDLKGLKAVMKECGLTAPRGKASDEDAILAILMEHLGLEFSEEGTEEEGEEGVTYDEVANMDDAELLAFAKEQGVKIPRGKDKDLDFVFTAVCEHLGLEPAEEGEAEDGADEGDEPYTVEELEAMSDDELLEVADANGIEIPDDILDDGQAILDAVCAGLGLVEEEEITADMVNAMTIEELNDLVADFEGSETPIKLGARDSKNLALYRKAVIKSLNL